MNAWRKMIYEDARRPRAEQMSFVLHLGDFIYEVVKYPEDGQDGMDRGRRLTGVLRYPKGERVARSYHVPVDLDDYRTAYKSYLLDTDLQDARARWPFVPVWDNHEFSWNGYQSTQVNGGDPPRPAQKLKVAASQAWYEYQPARVIKEGKGDAFEAPTVENKPLSNIDARGVGQEPNNLAAIHALRIERAFRFGKNIDMILTDNRSFQSAPIEGANIPGLDFGTFPEIANDILEAGREYPGGAPATLRIGSEEIPNPQRDAPPQAYLGIEQMKWFKERLRAAKAPWKIWGHSFGTLTWRTDPQNLPDEFKATWPSTEYGVFNRSYVIEHAEIFGMIRDEGITGLAIVAGDKHSFWAGYPSETLPPRPFEPVAVEFVTGSISQQGSGEVQTLTYPKDNPCAPSTCTIGPTAPISIPSARPSFTARAPPLFCVTLTIRRKRGPRATQTMRLTSPSPTSGDTDTQPYAPRRTSWKPSSYASRRHASEADARMGGRYGTASCITCRVGRRGNDHKCARKSSKATLAFPASEPDANPIG